MYTGCVVSTVSPFEARAD